MNKLVRHHFPASLLPDQLREGIDLSKDVTVTIVEEETPHHVMSLDEIFATRTPPHLTREQIDQHVRQLREDRDDV
jgi:hypothetical protein